MRAAIDAVANRGDVDVNRFGLWGVNLGAYVALSEATNDRRVRATGGRISVHSPERHGRGAGEPLWAWVGSLRHQIFADDFWLDESSIPQCDRL